MIDFDKVINRRGSNCVKWEAIDDPDVLPLWVADMDFEAAPCIRKALAERVEHGIFGYAKMPEAYYRSVVGWFQKRHNWTIDPAHMLYTIGVVPAISAILKAICLPGEKVVVTTPVYNCFFSCIHNSSCEVLESDLLLNAEGKYEVNWPDFEAKCADEKTRVFILCNPHNPGGRVWTADELRHMSDICAKHHVWVISDEIHNELVRPEFPYTPFATVATDPQHTVVCTSASKSFNLAGLQLANIVCANDDMRRRIDRVINIREICDVGPFGIVATIAAYSDEGAAWLDELNRYIYANYQWLKEFVDSHSALHASRFVLMPIEGTYLAWLNVASLLQRLNCDVETLEQRLIHEAKVYFTAGSHYGAAGRDYLRINLACPRSVLQEAMHRFAKFIQ